MPKFSVLPPEGIERESWEWRSSLTLERYWQDHEATIESFGRERPPARRRGMSATKAARGFLSDYCRRRRVEGVTHRTVGVVGLPLPDGQPAYVALPEIIGLRDRAQRIAGELACDAGRVAVFLLTGQSFSLPWIEIETLWEDLGPSFVIRVGSADVTAEEVRQAYVTAARAAMGDRRERPLPAHVWPLVLKEREGRLAGLTWRERWQEWQAYSREWKIGGHARKRGEGDEKTGYRTLASYRAYIHKLSHNVEWVKRQLETADWERELRQQTEEDG